MFLVEPRQEIEARALLLRSEILRRRTQIENRIADRAERRPLIRCRKITRAPVIRPVVRPAAMIEDHHERRQVLVLGAEPVSHPCAVTRRARQDRAGGPLEMRERMIVGPAHARSGSTRYRPRSSPMCGNSSETSIPDCPYFLNLYGLRMIGPGISLLHLDVALAGQRLAVIFVERGLGVERVEVADAAAHEKRDDILRARLEMRLLRAKTAMSTPGMFSQPAASRPS